MLGKEEEEIEEGRVGCITNCGFLGGWFDSLESGKAFNFDVFFGKGTNWNGGC